MLRDEKSPVLACALALLAGAGCGHSADERANVLLVSLDSVRADRISAYGYRPLDHPTTLTSPHIDRLAAEGLRFESAFSTTSWTLPSHVALVSGLADELHGVTTHDRHLDPALETLPELLSSRGWATGGFYSGPYLNPVFGFGQGFDTYVNCGTSVPSEVFQNDELGKWREVHQFSHETITSPALLEATSDWIRRVAEEGRPFFAFVHMWDPHYDYKAPEEFNALFDTNYTGECTGVRNDVVRLQPIDTVDAAHILSLYDAEIRYTDEHIGGLLDLLDELEVSGDTLVVVTSDHGEEFYERTRWGHQRSLYDEVLRVPLVMRFPGRLPEGLVVPGLARLQDIYPTIADLLDLPVPEYLSGRSLRPLWEDPTHPGFDQPLHLLVPHREIHVSGLRTPTEKLLWNHSERKGSYWSLERDPLELNERTFTEAELESGAHPSIERLRRFLAEIEEARAALPSTPGHGPIELDDSLLLELGDIGYTGDDADEEPR